MLDVPSSGECQLIRSKCAELWASGLTAALLAATLTPVERSAAMNAPASTDDGPAKAVAVKDAPKEDTDSSTVRWPWRVLDRETGKPLPGAAITVRVRKPSPDFYCTSVSPELLGSLSYRSDNDGRFVVNLPESLRKFSDLRAIVSGTLDGYTTEEQSYAFPSQPPATLKESTLRLLRGKPVLGRILNPDGSPAVRLCVAIGTDYGSSTPHHQRETSYGTTYTDVGGRFQFNVPLRGETTILLQPPKALRVEQSIGETRGSIGDIRLKSGIMVHGRVVDETGKPLSYVSVYLDSANNHCGDWRVITDAEGRYEMEPQLPGEYWIYPAPGLELNAQTPPDHVPEAYRKYILPDDDVYVWQPLRATFGKYKATLRADQPAPEVELKAIPHATLTARFVDHQGRPIAAWPWRSVGGWLDDQWWGGSFESVPDKPDTITAIVPRGLGNLDVATNPAHGPDPQRPAKGVFVAFLWRWTPKSRAIASVQHFSPSRRSGLSGHCCPARRQQFAGSTFTGEKR